MKKIYISALAVALIGSGAFAQNSITPARAAKMHTPGQFTPAHGSNSINPTNGDDRVTPFWTEDFSGGSIPSGWTNIDDTSAPGEEVTFEWTNDPDAIAISALGFLPSSTFMSATASNGYLWADSDRQLAGAPAVPAHMVVTTTPIDCQGQNTVLFTMQSLIGVYENNASEFVKVRVSADGVNWDEYFPFPCLTAGGDVLPPCERWSANPQLVEIDITATAANQPTVYLQFEWDSGWEYFWAIDDLALSEIPQYDRNLLSAIISHTNSGVQYGRVPIAQLGPDFTLGASVRNLGQMDQNNVIITAEVLDPLGAASFSASQTFSLLASGDTAVMEQIVSLPGGLVEGTYTVNFSVSSDEDGLEEDLTNDTRVRNFTLDNNIYSLDNIGLNVAGTEILTTLGTGNFTGSEDGFITLGFYEITNDITVYGLEIVLGGNSVEGAVLVAAMRDTADVLPNPAVMTIPFAESDIYVLTAADVAAGVVQVPFFDPVLLTPNAYFAGVEMFSDGGQTDVSVVNDGTIPQPSIASLIFISGSATTSGNGNAIGVRLITDPTIGISEVERLNGITVFPNPSNGIFRVNAEVAGVYTVEVTNVIGEIVHAERINGSTEIDLSNAAKGVYMVRVSNETASTVQRVTLK
ncbi:MAG: T9SS type A sorting domain-containing protein [Flavobacteriales bacterium]|nr:T9SS type A sorting domain-containing protein [Flavobacteriales bacterium]